MRRRAGATVRVVLALAGLGLFARADVLVLDAAGGGDFKTLFEVASNAHDGDVILVRPGNYSGPPMSAGATFQQSLTIMADGTGEVNLPGVHVVNLAAGKSFILRGVRLVNAPFVGGMGSCLMVNACEGAVLVEDCYITCSAKATIVPHPAVIVLSASLTLVNCEIAASAGIDVQGFSQGATWGNWGLRALAAQVALSGCKLTGGAGGNDLIGGFTDGAGSGGTALVSTESDIWLSGCEVVGGDGGDENGIPFSGGPSSGGAAVLADALSSIHVRDTTFAGGAGGTNASGTGAAGPTLDGPPEVLLDLPGPARTLRLDAPLAEGAHGVLEVHGAPGELAVLLPSLQGAWLPVLKDGGVLVAGPPAGVPVILGPLDASGTLILDVAAPHLGLAPDESFGLLLQLLTSSGPELVLGDASAFLMLAPGF